MMKWEQEAPNLILGAAKNIIAGKVRSLYPTKVYDVSQDALNELLPQLREDITPPKSANVLNFSGGMQVLTDRIVNELNKRDNVKLIKGTTARSLDYNHNGYKVRLDLVNSNLISLKSNNQICSKL